MRMIWIIFSFIACAWNGMKLISGRAKGDLARFYENSFGFSDPQLDDAWDRLEAKGQQWHDAKNLLVEWNRLEAQRGAKSFCAVIVIAFFVGIGIGILI